MLWMLLHCLKGFLQVFQNIINVFRTNGEANGSRADTLFQQGLANVHDIATFIGIGCCYAGFLGGVAFMMEGVHAKELSLKCAAAQAIGGVVAGVIANYAYLLIF